MDNSILGLSGIQDTMSYAASGASKTSRDISALKDQNLDKATDKELMDVCKQFEAYFLEQVFKEMSKTSMSSDETGSNGSLVSFFKDQTIASLAQDSTEKDGLGLAQMLYEQMKRNNVVNEPTENK